MQSSMTSTRGNLRYGIGRDGRCPDPQQSPAPSPPPPPQHTHTHTHTHTHNPNPPETPESLLLWNHRFSQGVTESAHSLGRLDSFKSWEPRSTSLTGTASLDGAPARSGLPPPVSGPLKTVPDLDQCTSSLLHSLFMALLRAEAITRLHVCISFA